MPTEAATEDVQPLSVTEALETSRTNSLFVGHPATDESEGEQPEAPEEAGEEQEPKEEATEQAEETESEEQPEQEPEPKIKFKYASHEEAERGAKEAERRMHEAIQEARRIREEVDQIKQQVSNSVKSGEMTQQQGDELNTIFASMLSNIKGLDPESETYDTDLAKIWSNTIGRVTEATARKVVQEEQSRYTQAIQAKEAEKQQMAEIDRKATLAAKKAGLSIHDESSVDYELFWSLAQKAVGETVDDRIAWTVNRVKSLKSSLTGKTLESQQKAQTAQKQNRVLERGSSRATRTSGDKEDHAPLSIYEALARTERRI